METIFIETYSCKRCVLNDLSAVTKFICDSCSGKLSMSCKDMLQASL